MRSRAGDAFTFGIAAAFLTLAACSGSAGGSSPPNGSTGTAGSTGAAGTSGGPPPLGCLINILPIAPSSFDGLVAGPGAMLRVRGELTGTFGPSFDWKWSVTLADGSPVEVIEVGNDPSLIEFALDSFGTYSIAVELTGSDHCAGGRTVTVARPGARLASFRVRVTPPPASGLPAQDLERQVVGGAPSGGNTLALVVGIRVPLDVRRAADDTPLGAYVRLTDAVSGAVVETRTTRDAPGLVTVAPGSYAMLVVPEGDVAPALYPVRSAAALVGTTLMMDDGATVNGTVMDAAGKPIAGAAVVLRAGALVSTTGSTDSAGAFHLYARSGTFGVTVVSSLTAGALESKLAAAGGVVVDTAIATPTAPLALKIQPGPLAEAAVALTAQDAVSLGPAARVTLEAVEPLANIATVTMGVAAPRMMAGDVRVTIAPKADGTLTTGGLPRGRYRMTVYPADAGSRDGVTSTELDLRAGNLAPLSLPLSPKVKLSGKLLPATMASGVRLLALDEAGLPITATADAGPGGVFELAVSPLRRYTLRALPRPDQLLARASFPAVGVASVDVIVPDRSMPRALLFAGRVVDPDLHGVGTSLVQAFCISGAPGCADDQTPVAETVTRSDGTFQVMLPDPDGTP
jgi:hypothetical protein